MSQWDRVRSTFERVHADLFEGTRYQAEFFNYSGGSYDPDDGHIEGESRTSIGTEDVEIVPPSIDTSVRVGGTSFSWDTSIRLPQSDGLVSNFKPLGEDAERPTEVEITDQVEDDTELYELHGYNNELGSGLIMCRLVEA